MMIYYSTILNYYVLFTFINNVLSIEYEVILIYVIENKVD
jgi:hypothetical protein